MSVATEITRLINAKTALKESIEAKGVTVEDTAKLDEYPALVDSIPQGGGNEYTEDEYLTFTAEQDNSSISLQNYGGNTPIIYYKKNNGDYALWDYSSISMNNGDVIKMYGENNFKFSISTTTYSNFVITGKIAASGVTNSLLSRNKTPVITPYCYYFMFHNCTALTTAPELPSTTLTNACYQYMFSGCTNLTTAPELPATALDTSCYSQMFQKCTSLTSSPALPATTLASSCYSQMFQDCTNLIIAPELPATTLASSCYSQMFQRCTSLTTAPELLAITLVSGCYNYMFSGCTELNYIKALFITTPSTVYTNNWLGNVAATGTFVKNVAATWEVSGANGIPENWTVETVTE